MNSQNKNEKEKQDKKLYKRITDCLYKIGVSPQVKGFTCLREAIKVCLKNGALRGELSKTVYPEAARNTGSTKVRVERNIRHAVGRLDDTERINKINGLLGCEALTKYDKPTSGLIIYLLAEKLSEDSDIGA